MKKKSETIIPLSTKIKFLPHLYILLYIKWMNKKKSIHKHSCSVIQIHLHFLLLFIFFSLLLIFWLPWILLNEAKRFFWLFSFTFYVRIKYKVKHESNSARQPIKIFLVTQQWFFVSIPPSPFYIIQNVNGELKIAA